MKLQELSTKKRSMTYFSIEELINLVRNGQIQLRDTDQTRIRSIRNYLLENALTENIYIPPLIMNLEEGKINDSATMKLAIIDGSQRMKAFVQLEDSIFKALKSFDDTKVEQAYKLKYLIKETHIALQVFENLSEAEAAQLYLDVNLKGKKVALSKRISFDSRNHLNVITNQVLQSHSNLKIAGVELEKHNIVRPKNKNLVSLSQLRQIVGIFITGHFATNIEDKIKTTYLQNGEYIQLIHLWLDQLFKLCPPEEIGDYHQSMLASYPILIAVAQFANDQMENQPFTNRHEWIVKRMTSLQDVDWTPDNPIWQEEFRGMIKGRKPLFYLANDKSNMKKLRIWLYSCGR